MNYSNSPLATENCILISNLYASRKDTPITKVTIHHQAGCLTGQKCKALWEAAFKNRGSYASANYAVFTDGTITLLVPEQYRAFTSSNSENDRTAVTIEVANVRNANYDSDPNRDWVVSDEAYEATIKLVADICERNGIEQLTWTGDKTGNLTVHRMFAATHCPGNYLYSRMPEIADRVNALIKEEAMDISKLTDQECYEILKKANKYAGTLEPEAAWAIKAVSTAKANGISDGTRPRALITREEVMGMCNNVKGL